MKKRDKSMNGVTQPVVLPEDTGNGCGRSGEKSGFFSSDMFTVGVMNYTKLGLMTHIEVNGASMFDDNSPLVAWFEGNIADKFQSDHACLMAFPPDSLVSIFDHIRESGRKEGYRECQKDIRGVLGLK